MSDMKWARRALAAVALVGSSLLAPVMAAPVLSIKLTPVDFVGFGQMLTADIMVSGLTDPTGGFAFDLNFDATRMDFQSFVADPDLKMGALPLDLSLGHVGSTVNVVYLADALISSGDLGALQGASFRLATVDFKSLTTAGFANFSLSGFSVSEYDGLTSMQGVTATGARVCVDPNAGAAAGCGKDVPEPASALLVAVALGGLGVSRRLRREVA